jgi:hypothetical protein
MAGIGKKYWLLPEGRDIGCHPTAKGEASWKAAADLSASEHGLGYFCNCQGARKTAADN